MGGLTSPTPPPPPTSPTAIRPLYDAIVEPGLLTRERLAPPVAPPRPLRSPLALEPARHGSWASVWFLAMGETALFLWLLSLGAGAHNAWPGAPVGHLLLLAGCLAPIIVRVVTLRLGLEPTVDERFSWHDFPERRAAYETQVASHLPRTVRLLRRATRPMLVAGQVLYMTGDLASIVRHLLS